MSIDDTIDTPADDILMDITPEGIAMITLNRPEAHNALLPDMVQKLSEIFDDLEDQDGIRAVLIDGAGASFSVGDDIEVLHSERGSSESEYREHAGNVALMLLRLRALPFPTIALVHGFALSTGLGIVAACDIAVATKDAQFGMPDVRIGLIPAAAAPYVAEAIGIRQTRRYTLTGERFGAEEALRLGLIAKVVDDQSAFSGEGEQLVSLLMQGAPGALSQAKELLDLITYLPADEDLVDETASMFAERRHSDEAQKGIAAAAEKRLPDWSA